MDQRLAQNKHIVGAIVVLYFPNAAHLKQLLRCLSHETTQIFVIDNTPLNHLEWLSYEWFTLNNLVVTYYPLGDNYGIAKAQNIGVELAIKHGCDHIILFDQDSNVPLNMISNLLSAEQYLLENSVKVGSIGPLFRDEKTKKDTPAIKYGLFSIKGVRIDPTTHRPIQTNYLIASGSLIRTNVFRSTGLMREDFFIDWVDIEWAWRAKKLGYSHYIVPNVVMLHNIGDNLAKIGNKQVIVHSKIRTYYFIRNACYLFSRPGIDRQWRMHLLFRIPLYILKYTLLSKEKYTNLKQLLRACIYGFSGKLGRTF